MWIKRYIRALMVKELISSEIVANTPIWLTAFPVDH
jgi:hypothetical protein